MAITLSETLAKECSALENADHRGGLDKKVRICIQTAKLNLKGKNVEKKKEKKEQ